MRSDLPLLLHKVVYELDRAADRILQREVGISYKRATVLLMVSLHGPQSQHELALRLGHTDAAISLLVRELNSDGYLTKTTSAGGGRKYSVALTDAGHDIITRCQGLLDQRFTELTTAADVDVDALHATIQKLAQGLERS